MWIIYFNIKWNLKSKELQFIALINKSKKMNNFFLDYKTSWGNVYFLLKYGMTLVIITSIIEILLMETSHFGVLLGAILIIVELIIMMLFFIGFVIDLPKYQKFFFT